MTSDFFAALGSVQDNTYEAFDSKLGFLYTTREGAA
jgi:hypothetical protein